MSRSRSVSPKIEPEELCRAIIAINDGLSFTGDMSDSDYLEVKDLYGCLVNQDVDLEDLNPRLTFRGAIQNMDRYSCRYYIEEFDIACKNGEISWVNYLLDIQQSRINDSEFLRRQ